MAVPGAKRVRWVMVAAAMVVLIGACSTDGDDGEADPPEPAARTGSVVSSPFTVGPVPDGFNLVAVGTGTRRQGWGEDCCGTDQPYTVLERADRRGGAVRVAIAGYENSEGGFGEVSSGYVSEVAAKRNDVDGKPGIWWPGDAEEAGGTWRSWPNLAVDEGDDLAVVISGKGANRKELEAVYRAVRLDGTHAHAPSFPNPPKGWAVVGSVDVEGVFALQASQAVDQPAGGRKAHSAGWLVGSRNLLVLTVPGRSLSLAAAAAAEGGSEGTTTELRTVDGRPVFVTDSGSIRSYRQRSVAIDAPWGDVVVATATDDHPGGADARPLPSIDALIRLARSVKRATPAQWRAFQGTVANPLDAQIDPGRIEITRGEADGIGWVLQTAAPGPSNFLGGDAGYDGSEVPDLCVKRSDWKRTCPVKTEVFDGGVVRTMGDPRLQVIISTRPAVMYQIIGPAFANDVGPMVAVPGGKLWVGVSRSTVTGFTCRPGVADPPRLELFASDGKPVGCLGSG